VYAAAAGASVGLRTPVPADSSVPKSTVEAIRVEVRDGQLLVHTSDAELFQPFFAFLLDVSNRIQLDAKAPATAFNDALTSWRRMLASSSLMADELQLGLAGELWALERLIRALGSSAVTAWTGPDRDAHDFRLAGREMEVKTTAGQHRRHVISRLDQLEASPGMELDLLSLQMVSAGIGDGWSLADQVAELRGLVSADQHASDSLNEKLSQWGWRDPDAHHYPRRRRLRTPPRIVPVDSACPRLVPSSLETAVGELANRIDDVTYRVDLENLGVEEGDPLFNQLLYAVQRS
jgi:hypothetical protein